MKTKSFLCRWMIFAVCLLPHSGDAQCPSFVKRAAIEGNPGNLPSGWFVYSKADAKGIYWSPLKSFSETLIPGTNDLVSWRAKISDDGKWILAGFDKTSGGELRLFKRDGTGMTVVPTNAPVANPVSGFVRNGPKGTEIFYGVTGTGIRGMAVNLTGATPLFGATRLIINCLIGGDQWHGIGISGNHAAANYGFICMDFVRIQSCVWQMVTIPNGGNGTADSYANRWPYTYNADSVDYSCNIDLSWDGAIMAHNPGKGWVVPPFGDTCFPVWDGAVNGDHKGPVLLPFVESSQPPMSMRDFYYQKSVSVNWTLPRFRGFTSDESGFNQWAFGNNPDYLIGMHTNIPSATNMNEWGAWMVQWKTNTWTRVTSPTTQALWPAFNLDSGQVNCDNIPGIPASRWTADRPRLVMKGGSQHRIEIVAPVAPAGSSAGISIFDLRGRLLRRIDAVIAAPPAGYTGL